jgi:cephalosporin hydroxylase
LEETLKVFSIAAGDNSSGRIVKTLVNSAKGIPYNEQVSFDPLSLYYGHQKITYRGIKAIRCPFDYVMYQMIINEVRPDLIIEIGTQQGGSAVYFSDLMDALQIDGEIHSIDVHDGASKNIKDFKRIKLFTEGREKYNLQLTDKFSRILVIEDAAHTYDCTIGAMEKFASIVTKYSYMIVEDGIVNELGRKKEFRGGPLRAIREFLPKHPESTVDRKWCDMFGHNATFNVNGYLKKNSD